MPESMVRLSAGRLAMSEREQALCFLAGANSIFAAREAPDHPKPGRRRRRSTLRDARSHAIAGRARVRVEASEPMADPLEWIAGLSRDWRAAGLERRLTSRTGGRHTNFATNDYLSLAGDPRVRAAAIEAIREHGFGSSSSPLVSGWGMEHERLCAELAGFEAAEAAVLFPSGYAACSATIAALAGRGDAIYSDRLNHASLIDGARLSRAEIRIYPHGDASALEALLQADRGRFRRSLIVTESVFGMDGDIAPLARLAELAEAFAAILLVDEAHATGVLGPGGRGGAAAAGVADRVHVRVGTLSKALGSLGGFVVSSRDLIDWLTNHARSLIFSTSLPAAAVAAARAASRSLGLSPNVATGWSATRPNSEIVSCGWGCSPWPRARPSFRSFWAIPFGRSPLAGARSGGLSRRVDTPADRSGRNLKTEDQHPGESFRKRASESRRFHRKRTVRIPHVMQRVRRDCYRSKKASACVRCVGTGSRTQELRRESQAPATSD